MTSTEFRNAAHAAVDWMADYLQHVGDRPVLPSITPGEFAAALPSQGPEEGESIEAILADFKDRIPPALTNWNHPRFFAYFAISGTEPGILGEMLAAALNVNGMLWQSCPPVTELEQVTLSWLRQWLGLPEPLFGILHDTASTSTLHAIVAAREFVDPESRESGDASRLVLYCSEFAHSSVEKGAFTAGIGRRNIRKIAVDSKFRMRPDALVAAVEQDLRAGLKPCCVVATVGTTAVASIDPVGQCAAICQEHGMWLHVDAAYAGPAAVLEEMRYVLDGAERSDSLVVNPHKWLLTPVDCSALYTRRPEVLRQAFSLVPPYLRTNQDERVVNLMDYSFVLGRRFRALKLWFVMRYYGRNGVAAVIRRHIEDAREFMRWLEADERFEIAAPVYFSLVCFRLKAGDAVNRQLVDDLNRTGVTFLAGTVLNGQFVIRLAVGHHRTTRDDLRRVWEKIRELTPQTLTTT